MRERPGIGDPVVLRDDRRLEYTSRVEGSDDPFLTVARPADLRAGIVFEVGDAFELLWTVETGVHVLPVALRAMFTENHLRLWSVEATADSRIEQRRDYVRVQVGGPIAVTVSAPSGDGTAERYSGQLVDISEVATQCTLEVPSETMRALIGRTVTCEFTMQSSPRCFAGHIIIVRDAADRRQCKTVVSFDISSTQADALRKDVFAEQLAVRRRAE